MTKPAKLKFTIYQGATFREHWQRLLCDYEVEDRGGKLVAVATGRPVPDADLQPDDYTGCTARLQARPDVGSEYVLFELSTANGGISLDAEGNVHLFVSDEQASIMKFGDDPATGAWTSCIAHLEIVRPNGDVERQFEITFTLSQEGTR